MKNKRVQLCESESVLEDFYNALASNNSYAMKKVHIPKSDVFYVREAIYNSTGEWYTLDHVERAMYLRRTFRQTRSPRPDRKGSSRWIT